MIDVFIRERHSWLNSKIGRSFAPMAYLAARPGPLWKVRVESPKRPEGPPAYSRNPRPVARGVSRSKSNPNSILYIIKTKKTLCHFLFSLLQRRPFLLFPSFIYANKAAEEWASLYQVKQLQLELARKLFLLRNTTTTHNLWQLPMAYLLQHCLNLLVSLRDSNS
jgi:hypothetical protein